MSSLADQIVARLLTMMTPIELLRIVEMEEAERLSSLSTDTLVREHADKVVKLSSRRNGMRVAHALMLREINEAGTVQEVPVRGRRPSPRRGVARATINPNCTPNKKLAAPGRSAAKRR